MPVRSPGLALALIAVLQVIPLPARVHAQPAKPAVSDAYKKKIARGYVDAGLAAQDAGDYATALELYAKAYDLVPHPVLLYNLGQAHRLAGHRAEARAMYGRFLAAVENGPEVITAKDWISRMDTEDAAALAAADQADQLAAEKAAADLAAERTAATAREADAAAARRAEAQRQRDATATAPISRPSSTTATLASAAERDAPADRGRNLRLAGIATGVLGLTAVGAGVAFGLKARSLSDELSRPGTEFNQAKEDQGFAAERNMYIGYVAGGVLVAGGVGLYLFGRAKSHELTRIAIAPRTDGAMVVFARMLP